MASLKEVFKTQYKNFSQGWQTELTCLGASRWIDQKVPFCPHLLWIPKQWEVICSRELACWKRFLLPSPTLVSNSKKAREIHFTLWFSYPWTVSECKMQHLLWLFTSGDVTKFRVSPGSSPALCREAQYQNWPFCCYSIRGYSSSLSIACVEDLCPAII